MTRLHIALQTHWLPKPKWYPCQSWRHPLDCFHLIPIIPSNAIKADCVRSSQCQTVARASAHNLCLITIHLLWASRDIRATCLYKSGDSFTAVCACGHFRYCNEDQQMSTINTHITAITKWLNISSIYSFHSASSFWGEVDRLFLKDVNWVTYLCSYR